MITPELVDRVLAQIQKRYTNYEYFFEKLSSPDWISHLAERNFFKQPVDAVRQDGYINFPFWPDSDYLMRMAPLAPVLVSKTIMNIPETDNLRIHCNYIDAAIAMPVEDGFPIAVRETKWLKKQSYIYFLLPEKIEKMILYLANNGRTRKALEIAADVLSISANGNYGITENQFSIKLDLHHYKHIIDIIIPKLSAIEPNGTFNLFCDLLENAVAMKLESRTDLSCFWQAAIEDHPQNKESGVLNILVVAIRSTISLIATDFAEIVNIIEALRKREGTIFERIILHVLRVKFSLIKSLAIETMLDEQLFRNSIVRHEYVLLLKEGFKELSEEQQVIIIGWIKAGPMYEDKSINVECEDEWRRDKLSLISDYLSLEWKEEYKQLVNKYGAAHHPEFSVYHETGYGDMSQLTKEQLLEMPINDLIEYLEKWNPEEGWAKPTRYGLARVLLVAVKEQPEKFVSAAEGFITVDPTYVNNFIQGLNEAVKDNKKINWLLILNLCKKIINEPIEISGRISRYGDMDNGWTWTRKSIASLLASGFHEGEAEIPYQYRDLAWSVLSKLVDDNEPTVEREEKYLLSHNDPLDLAINTTRGEAVDCVIKYAIWVKRYLEIGGAKGFDGVRSVSEVQHVLEKHLDLQVDPSLAIRSIYGYRLVSLVIIDKEWFSKIVKKIFPNVSELEKYRWTAWQSYILSWPIYEEVYDVLQHEYQWAMKRLIEKSPNNEHDMVSKKTIEHLLILYGWGKFSISSEEGLIEAFFEVASDKVRAEVIESIGRMLRGDDDVSYKICKRFQELWEWRKQYQDIDVRLHLNEIKSFGWLFSTNRFDVEWSVSELSRAISLSGTVEPAWLVVEQLDNEERYPIDQALSCLDLLIRNIKERWSIHHVSNHAKNIIDRALMSNEVTRKKANALQDYLVALGYRDFLGK